MNPEPLDLNALLERLRERYPVFRECRPLALGSGREILAAAPDLGVSKLALRRWLNLWVNRTPYLRALATDGAVRYALDGSPGDPVSLDHQEHALAELKRRLALKAKSRKRKPSVADTPRPAPTPEPSPVVAPVITAATLGRPLITLKRKAAA